MQSYFTYILYSSKFDRYYIGQTSDFEKRLERHNSGYENATAPYAPWKMVWYTQKFTRSEAVLLEKKRKNLNRLRLESFILKYQHEGRDEA